MQLLKAFMHIWYGICKIANVKDNRILFLSRQSDEVPLDFEMIRDELEKVNWDKSKVEEIKKNVENRWK